MSATVCVDAGTSLVKAVVLDAEGHELVVVREPAPVDEPRPGWSEQDMDAVLDLVGACVREAVERSPVPVGRLALTGQGDGAWLVDRYGRPVRPAVLWNDARSRGIVERWQREGVLDEAFRRNGSLGNLGLPHAIMAWFAEHQPDVLRHTWSVLTCGSWLFGALTGSWGLHPSEASAPWLDLATGQPSDALVELYGLTPWRALVPPVLGPGQTTRPLSAAAAGRLGLPSGIPVTLAPYDVVSTPAGGGAVAPGDGFCVLGTTLCTGVLLDRPDTSGPASGLTLLGQPGEPVVRAFPTLAGTGVLGWLARLLGVDDAAALVDLAADSPPGARGVRMWPYLSPAGERSPFLDPDARGLVGGLSLLSRPADLARSALEGLAHVIADCVQAAGRTPATLTVSGGGSASDLWCETIADVTGTTVVRTDGREAGARGALLSSMVAAGEAPSVEQAARAVVRETTDFVPDPGRRDFYAGQHAEFLTVRELVGSRWSTWVASNGLAETAANEFSRDVLDEVAPCETDVRSA